MKFVTPRAAFIALLCAVIATANARVLVEVGEGRPSVKAEDTFKSVAGASAH